MTRREIKTRARQALKKHYMMLVMVSLIAVFLGLQSSNFDNFVRMYSPAEAEKETVPGTAAETETGTPQETEMKADTRVTMGSTGLMDVLRHTMSGNTEKGRELSEALKKKKIENAKDGNRILGGSRGALSKIVNGITSGSLFVIFVSGINSLFGSEKLGSLILVALACAGVTGFYLLIVNQC